MSQNNTRWKIAQSYEKDWWQNHKADIDWYQDVANEIQEKITPYLKIQKDTGILEIGAGPCGPISYFKSEHRYAIEPLNEIFAEQYSKYRDQNVHYRTGKGEELPFDDVFFDLVIIDNVLDHCDQPLKVLSEIDRVLKVNGIVYLRVHVYHAFGRRVRRIMEKFMIDKGHPYSFSESELQKNFAEFGWQLLFKEKEKYFTSWFKDLKSFTKKGLFKAILFTTKASELFILQKVNKSKNTDIFFNEHSRS